jgi:hypothetical protein
MPKTPKQRRRPDVPNSDHVARYCNPQRVIRDPITRTITGLYPQAFELRPGIREIYLSTHWMEALATDVHNQFQAVVAALRKKLDVRPLAALARLNVGLVVQAGAARKLSIRIRDRSRPNDLGYSGIYGMPPDNSDLVFLALLTNECCIEIRGLADIDALPSGAR